MKQELKTEVSNCMSSLQSLVSKKTAERLNEVYKEISKIEISKI